MIDESEPGKENDVRGFGWTSRKKKRGAVGICLHATRQSHPKGFCQPKASAPETENPGRGCIITLDGALAAARALRRAPSSSARAAPACSRCTPSRSTSARASLPRSARRCGVHARTSAPTLHRGGSARAARVRAPRAERFGRVHAARRAARLLISRPTRHAPPPSTLHPPVRYPTPLVLLRPGPRGAND